MLIFPKDYENKLGFDQVLEMVRQKCHTPAGEEYVSRVKPSSKLDEVMLWLNQTDEMLQILSGGENVPSREFMDIRAFLKRSKVAGVFLQAEEFGIIKSTLRTLYEWTQFLKKRQTQSPELFKLTLGFISDQNLINEIDRIVDERGLVRDNASPELEAIRNLLVKKEREVRTAINKILKKAIHDKLTDEDSIVTIREGRLVIPIRAENKRRIQGFVHDESSTGQTVYLEPTDTLQLNNEVRELLYQERREIARILTRLTDLLRSSLKDIEKGTFFLGLLDFIHAKAVFSQEIEAVKPKTQKYPVVHWMEARHPLLWLSHNASGKPTIPLSLRLNRQENRILVISGPNAGGKSVALKTVGLIQYMFQCGFMVPVDERSEFGIFRSVFLDIGDTQSLENDLSTYSSHLTAMKYFNEMADRDSLFLIDEFGTGTEPQFGGAIAESILNELHRKKAFGVVTTHYQNLKKFAENNMGVINGAMKYDVAELEPLFELEIGKPGSSFAFEIAKKIGLPKLLIEDAKTKIGSHQVDYEFLLNDLEKERNKYRQLNKKAEKSEKEIFEIRKDYEEVRKMVQEERKDILKKAKNEARQILAEANKKIEGTIRQIKEQKADKEQTRKAREGLEAFKKQRLEEREPKAAKKAEIKPGDAVTIIGQDTAGEVMHLKGKQAQVRFGNIISFIDLKKLEKTSKSASSGEKKKSSRVGGVNMLEKMSKFNGELDIRGVRAEEALGKVDEYIDQALMLGTDQVRILHGKGHGVLRELVRNHLRRHQSVASAVDEHVDFGGSGITIVTFK
ncbi:endonuclease MutS2 [Marinoscillum sp. MHG1-6]|uniref:endonuclease MutS2 n=1 Tax=Marinoscillum sp. MHG1-6 TaxID=2959627 RepID=UPI002157D3C6|nr:endonuclease MutS2 [Marinoscillum sp. MHG1-6]